MTTTAATTAASGSDNAFINYLHRQTAFDWQQTLDALAPEIHEVDRNATRIWFHFFPLDLFLALEEAADERAELARDLLLEGNYQLSTQFDTSAHFLYGHRFWATVKATLAEYAKQQHAANFNHLSLAEVAREIARRASETLKTNEKSKQDASLLLGISLVALMTLRQTNLNSISLPVDEAQIKSFHTRQTPDQILHQRAKEESQGLLGFLRNADKRWTITYDESKSDYRFTCVNEEELASGAARDQHKDWRAMDARCIEGPIPVQCRAAACGACWVGVLGGAEKLSPVNQRLEGKNIREFGYINTADAQPVIRLACMAQALGAASIVIPPWNGFFGKYLQKKATGEKQDEAFVPTTEA